MGIPNFKSQGDVGEPAKEMEKEQPVKQGANQEKDDFFQVKKVVDILSLLKICPYCCGFISGFSILFH